MSNANDDFPEPDSPVITTNLSLGISRFIFFKLCSFAPFIIILSFIFLSFPTIFYYILCIIAITKKMMQEEVVEKELNFGEH